MQGFVWSSMSSTGGGFICGGFVDNVTYITPNILTGSLYRNINGHIVLDPSYEFFTDQFIPIESDIWNQPSYPLLSHVYKTGDKVKVSARQYWGGTFDHSLNGTVYQDQHEIGASVIVSVNPNHFDCPTINRCGGSTLEVYPQQLTASDHSEKHPTYLSPNAAYSINGFRLAKPYRQPFSIKSWLTKHFS